MENNEANTRFNDFTGSIAADMEAPYSDIGQLEEIAKMHNVDISNLKPVGFHATGSYGDIQTYLICKDIENGTEILKLISSKTEDFLALFKRIDIKLIHKGF